MSSSSPSPVTPSSLRKPSQEEQEEYEKLLSECSGIKLFVDEGHQIEKWSDYQFTSADGRTFALFLDGHSILHRLRAKDILINEADTEGIKQAESVAGMILGVGAINPPSVLLDSISLVTCWLECRRMNGMVPCDSEEYHVVLELNDGTVNIEDALLPPELRDDRHDGEPADYIN